MNMKRKYITAVLPLAPLYLFAAGFDHFVFAPHNGMTGAIIAHTSRYADKMYLYETMAGIGPAGLWPLAPALNMRLSGAYYFSKKCGIFFAVGNSLGCLPYPARRDINIVNATVISIGPVFRIDR